MRDSTGCSLHRLKRGALLILALALAPIVVAGCGSDSGSDGDSGNSFLIGEVVALTGGQAAYDVPAHAGATIAIKDINAKGKTDGKILELETFDHKTQVDQIANSAIKAIDAGASALMLSCDFDQAGPAATEAQNANMVSMSSCGASTKFGPAGAGPLSFTMATSATAMGAIQAEFAYESLKNKTSYALLDNSTAFSRELCAGFEDRWKELAGEGTYGTDVFQADDQSIASQIERIKNYDPDSVMLCSLQPAVPKALKQIRASGVDTPILAGDDLDGDSWKDAVPGVSDVYFLSYGSIYGDDPDPAVNRFVKQFEQDQGEAPPSGAAITGYSAIEALAIAADKAGSTDGTAMAEALESFKDEPLLVGPTTFTPEQHIATIRGMRIMKIEDGKSTFYEVWRPKSVPEPRF